MPAVHKMLVVSHSAAHSGAPLVLLRFLRWLREHTSVSLETVLLYGGPLVGEFQALGPVTLVWEQRPQRPSLPGRVLGRVLRRNRQSLPSFWDRFANASFDLVLSNTAVNGPALSRLRPRMTCPFVSFIHELPYVIDHAVGAEQFSAVRSCTDYWIACSGAVEEALIGTYGIPPERVKVVHAFIDVGAAAGQPGEDRGDVGRRTREELGIPPEALVVGACGTVEWRKGPDLFIQLAREMPARIAGRPVHFAWLGGELHGASERSAELRYDLTRAGLAERVHLLGARPAPTSYFAMFDLFVLPSREDPFPLVCLEAAAQGLPVVCFRGAGGIAEFVEDDAGVVVPYLDVPEMAAAATRLLATPELRASAGACARARVAQRHDVSVGAPLLYAALRGAASCDRVTSCP